MNGCCLNLTSPCRTHFQDDGFRFKAISATAFLAIVCVALYFLAHYNIMNGMNPNVQWAFAGAGAALAILTCLLSCYQPEKFFKDLFKKLGYPNAVIYRRCESNNDVYQVGVDLGDDCHTPIYATRIGKSWPDDDRFEYDLKFNLFDHLYGFVELINDVTETASTDSNNQSQEEQEFWKYAKENALILLQKLNVKDPDITFTCTQKRVSNDPYLKVLPVTYSITSSKKEVASGVVAIFNPHQLNSHEVHENRINCQLTLQYLFKQLCQNFHQVAR